MLIDSNAADRILLGGDLDIKALTNGIQHFHSLRHHFRADTITG